MKNFLITAEGRSGTKFLSRMMNKSGLWTVAHEPAGANNLTMDISQIQKRFNRTYHGEVNSRLRFRIKDIVVDKKGVILRDPSDIWLSWSNKKQECVWNDFAVELKKTYEEFENLIDPDIEFILFEKMVSDLSYLRQIFECFGINDVDVTKEMQAKKVNINRIIKYHNMSEFNHEIQDIVAETRAIYKRLKTKGED